MHEISGAIIAITSMQAFIPVAFMSGPVGISDRTVHNDNRYYFVWYGIDTYTCALCNDVKKTIMVSRERKALNFRWL
jgi:hypothetical protein